MGALISLSFCFFLQPIFCLYFMLFPFPFKSVITTKNTFILYIPLSSFHNCFFLISSQSSPSPFFFFDLCSTKRSSPPQPRYLPGDGGQQEAGGQRSKFWGQQWELCKLHALQRHGALLCPTATRTPPILQRLSLLTQPNRDHGQRTAA